MIAELLAHLRLLGRHHTTVTVGGLTWGYCSHVHPRTGSYCWLWRDYDGYCQKHNASCWDTCSCHPGT